MAKPIMGNKTPLKYGETLDSLIQIRVTEKQRELIRNAGSSDYWRDLMVNHAKEILQIQAVDDGSKLSLFDIPKVTNEG